MDKAIQGSRRPRRLQFSKPQPNRFITAIIVTVIACLTSGGSVLAACGKGNGKGADISACTDEILAEQERTLDLLDELTQNMGQAGILKAEEKNAATRQLGYLRNSHDRGRREKNDATDVEFEYLTMIGEASDCELRLKARFDPGPPHARAVCSEEEIGENKCDEVCQFTPAEQERNTKRGQRLEEDLAEVLENAKIANDELENEMQSGIALTASAMSASSATCVFDNPHPNVDPFPPASIMFHNQILVVQETITNVGKSACQQDAAGFNTSTACIALDVLEGIQKGLTTFVNTINGNFTSATVDATFTCVEELKADSAEQGEQLAEMETKIEDLQAEVGQLKALVNDVKTLLATPQGRRDGFPEN